MPVSASSPKSARSTYLATGCSATDAKRAMAHPAPRKAMIAHAATRAALLMASSVVAFIRTPRYSSAGGARRSSESIASWTALTSKVLDMPSVLGNSASGVANQNRSLRVT